MGKQVSAFCGFKTYSSTDLSHWTDWGFLFDATMPVWQTRCNGKTYGCFRPHVIYNKKTKLYVLWINVYDNQVGYRVFVSKSPIGPFFNKTRLQYSKRNVNSFLFLNNILYLKPKLNQLTLPRCETR